MKKELPKSGCTYCWNKRYYTVLCGVRGSEDFGGDGFGSVPKIHAIACSRCNRGNKRKIKSVKANWWDCVA